MAYDEFLVERIRRILSPYEKYVEEKRMMGGLIFMLKGKMCCGVDNSRLMVRVLKEKYESSLKKQHCSEMNFTGKTMKGFLFVHEDGFVQDKELKTWINLGIEFVEKEVSNVKSFRNM